MIDEKDFDLEYKETLQILKDRNKNLKEFDYFLNLFKDRKMFLKDNNKSRVIMLSHSFPEEIIRALNLTPCYVFGGSYSSSQFDYVRLPKDCTDQAKSILGILKSKFFDIDKDDVLLIPYSNDHYKILEKNLKDMVTIIGYDDPNDKDDLLNKKRYISEIKRVSKELSRHFKKHICHIKLKNECLCSKKAAFTFSKLEELFNNNYSDLSLSGFMFIMNSYYIAKDKKEWIYHLEKLINELKSNIKPLNKSDKMIVLMGSPIYPPNYKVLFEIENLNISVKKVFHQDSVYLKLFNTDFDKYSLINLVNLYSINKKDEFLVPSNVDGVIYHIIKGDIYYSYHYQNVENKLINNNIPTLKIETVYGNQDIEQIKLRIQAFLEMLNF